MMKTKPRFLMLGMITLIAPLCFARDDISAKLTPSAIEARIKEIRMGNILIKTKPGADVKVQQVRHEFLFGTAITDALAEKDPNAMSAQDRRMFLKFLARISTTPCTKTP